MKKKEERNEKIEKMYVKVEGETQKMDKEKKR